MEEIGKRKGIRKCAGAVIFSEDQRILIARRSSRKKSGVGKWQFPQGGVEEGEDTKKAVEREIYEEVGLSIDSPDILAFVSRLPEPYIYKNTTYGSKHEGQEVTWFLYHMHSSKITQCKLDNEIPPEFDEIKWATWDELLKDTVDFKFDMFTYLKSFSVPVISEYLCKK
eukprot:TRINITY_DN2280_c0_g1_i1.p1 TRINITY_DN2280_c0_g1~~TRINITY_DN2280_c0_g1_i1.p1  ORF type:complete len:169 (-),score=38.30 TRINITY_DN2280_c0_g1_i1:20-526(-)